MEKARAFKKLIDEFGMLQREIAEKIGKSREVVANTLRLLNLPSSAQEALSKGMINESQARLLLSISELKDQEMMFNELLKNNWSVRELRSQIGRLGQTEISAAPIPPETPPAPPQLMPADPELDHLKSTLEEFLGAKVTLKRSGENGELAIEFYSKDELRGILDKILKHNPPEAPPLS